MKKFWANKSSKTSKIIIASVAALALVAVVALSNSFMAIGTINTLMQKAGTIFQSIYTGLLGIVSILAVAIIAWCFCVKMFSKNPRSVDEANQWMKRVAISWLCFMLINVFIKIGVDIITETQANTTSPWTA